MSNINSEDINIKTEVEAKPQEIEEVKDSGIEPDKKDPNTTGQSKREFRDGGMREWSWSNLPLTDEPLWNVGRKVLGLSDSEAGQYQNEIGDVMKLVMEILQSDDEFEIAKFLRKELRFTPSNGNRIYNLMHNLIALRKEQDDK